jgi:hypothetical protein
MWKMVDQEGQALVNGGFDDHMIVVEDESESHPQSDRMRGRQIRYGMKSGG